MQAELLQLFPLPLHQQVADWIPQLVLVQEYLASTQAWAVELLHPPNGQPAGTQAHYRSAAQ